MKEDDLMTVHQYRGRPKTLATAIRGGDYLEILLAQRREIVASMTEEKGMARAALHRQVSTLSKEIDALQAARASEGSVVARTDDEDWDATAI